MKQKPGMVIMRDQQTSTVTIQWAVMFTGAAPVPMPVWVSMCSQMTLNRSR